MADLFDQLASADTFGNPFLEESEPVASSGIVSIQDEEDVPIFRRETFTYRPSSRIVDVAVSNNVIAVALEGCIVNRILVTSPFEVDNVSTSKRTDDEISKIFLDPSGRHLIVSMKSSELFYLGRNNKKPRLLHRFKNHKIESIAWNKHSTNEITTGHILFGTSKGLLLESEIDSEERFLSIGTEKSVKVVFNINEGRDREEALTEVHMEKVPGSTNRYVVLLSSPSRFYQFVGDASNESPIFQPVMSVFSPAPAPYLELPGSLCYSNMGLFFPKPKGLPNYFGWLTEPGIYFGKLDFRQTELKNNITKNTRLLPSTEGREEDCPVSIALSEFHCILLYENKFETICILNDEINYSELIPPRFGTMIGLRTDANKRTVWAFTETTLFRYHVVRESRDVWIMHLERGEFELAKDHCRHNAVQMDLVLRRQAESLFEQKQYIQSATYYALTQISFEEVTLKFLQVEDSEALKMFLQKKLVTLKSTDKTQLTMLVTWLIELYLNQLGRMRDKKVEKGRDYEVLQDDFRRFINQSKIKECLEHNKNVAYDLLSSHGDTENMIFFAMLMKDYDRVIQHRIQQDDYLAALEVLKKQPEDERQHESFEKFSPTLIQHIPKELVEVWKQRKLTPRKLIPALVSQTQSNTKSSIKHAVDYLEHCVYKLGNREQAIHNYLISLYCKINDEAPLVRYLHGQGEEISEVCYEPKYALRVCSENNKQGAAVKIYSTMGLFEEAVDLALQVNIEEAKLYADKAEYDEALKKKLWLKVARYVVDKEQDIGRAMELLKECPLLKIEDILPFFPDFVTIDHFKDAICDSLSEYNQHIDQLKSAMQDATESAKTVRSQIHEVRTRYGTIDSQEKCAVCYFPLLTRAFYYFPCTHVFHSDCLVQQVKLGMKERHREKVKALVSKLSNVTATTSAVEQTRTELEDLIAGECIYCGETMIRSIDEPLLDENDVESESWQ